MLVLPRDDLSFVLSPPSLFIVREECNVLHRRHIGGEQGILAERTHRQFSADCPLDFLRKHIVDELLRILRMLSVLDDPDRLDWEDCTFLREYDLDWRAVLHIRCCGILPRQTGRTAAAGEQRSYDRCCRDHGQQFFICIIYLLLAGYKNSVNCNFTIFPLFVYPTKRKHYTIILNKNPLYTSSG